MGDLNITFLSFYKYLLIYLSYINDQIIIIRMENSQQLILMATALLIVIFAGTLALRLGVGLKND